MSGGAREKATDQMPVPVLLMVRELDQGGVERDVAKIATHLDPARFTPHVASYFRHGMRYEELNARGIPMLHIPVRAVLETGTLTQAWRLRQYLRLHNIRLLHSYDVSGIVGVPVGRSLGIPSISSQLSYRAILDRPTQALLRWTDSISSAVVVNCEAIRRYMIEDEGVPADRVELCYNGVETARFFPGDRRKPPQLGDAPLTVGTVCALRPEKGLKLLQSAFSKVRALCPGMKLVIVGSGPELPELQANAAGLNIQYASVFVPATPNVPEWLRGIDIFVLPSWSEAFSNSLLEAMACGCATIGSRVGGTPELTGAAGERGLLFEPGDAAKLAVRLTQYIESEDLRRRMGLAAARFASESLSIERAARRTAEIYEKQLARVSR
jgi:glycosyltransferase involved in cell wall biosynthesis